MPKKITLDDGTEETVYTEDEVKGLQAGSDKNKERKETIAGIGKDLGLGEDEKIEDKLNELKELSNPNFAKYRNKYKAMEAKLKNDGVEFDNEGNPVNQQAPLSSDDIQRRIDETVKTTVDSLTNSNAKSEALSKFTQEDQEVIRPHLDKLMNEYPNDLQDNLEIAVNKAFPNGVSDQVKQTLSSSGGLPPVVNMGGKKPDFTESEEGKQMLSEILPDNVKKAVEAKN